MSGDKAILQAVVGNSETGDYRFAHPDIDKPDSKWPACIIVQTWLLDVRLEEEQSSSHDPQSSLPQPSK